MKIIDASGPIYEGMWSYGDPFPNFKLIDLKEPDWVEGFHPKSNAFEGFSMLTGTYIDGPAHAFGIEKTYPMSAVPMEKIFGVDAFIFKFDLTNLKKEGKRPIVDLAAVKEAEKRIKKDIPERSILVLATGWGSHWEKDDFLTDAWFMEKNAVEYLVDKKPFTLVLDTAYIDCLENERGIWDLIYGKDISLVAPLVNLEKIKSPVAKIYICPLNILNTTGLPCRVIFTEE